MRYRSRSVRHSSRKAKRKLLSSFIIIVLLLFATLQWILPSVIGGVGIVRNIVKPVQQVNNSAGLNATLAPPVLFVPFEATNSAKIDIKGYATAGSKVNIYLDDELRTTVDVGFDGNLIAKDISLVFGKNNIYGKTVDEQSSRTSSTEKNTESLASKTIILTYDNEKPDLTVNEPDDGKLIQGGDKKVTVKGTTDADIPVLVNDSRVITNSDGSFSTTVALNDGDNTITIKAVDHASNSTQIFRKVTYQP
ncbi:MAG: hypothetical protein Q7R49_03995 [Candidatus Daviesbacteria bacterium]|nr:hypothetical protein [Candidatus Daviesbacteria bacterium]